MASLDLKMESKNYLLLSWIFLASIALIFVRYNSTLLLNSYKHNYGNIESFMDNIAKLVEQRISRDIEISVEQSNLKMHIKNVCNNNQGYIWKGTEQKKVFWNSGNSNKKTLSVTEA